MIGTGIFFSNAIFCTEFGIALKSKLNELKWYVKRAICISNDSYSHPNIGFCGNGNPCGSVLKIMTVFVLFAI